MNEEEYRKLARNKAARRVQKETGMKYTAALRIVEADPEKYDIPVKN